VRKSQHRKDKEHPKTQAQRSTHRNKEIRNLLLVSRPRFAVLSSAPGDVSSGAVDDHNHEEDEVEPGERTPVRKKNRVSKTVQTPNKRHPDREKVKQAKNSPKPRDRPPSETKPHIRHIIRLPHNLEPPINHDLVPGIRLNELRIFHCLPRNLRERVALDDLVFVAQADGVLLPVRAVPHPIEEDVYESEGGQGGAIPAVGGWVMVGEVQGAVAVGEGHTREVPEG
jgi:hypothetical protein